MGHPSGFYGKPVLQDELNKTIETNEALARLLDKLRQRRSPEPHNTSTTHDPERKESGS